MLLPSGNPFKCHEEVLYLQPIIPPKRFDIFHPDWGMLRRSRCVQIFILKIPIVVVICSSVVVMGGVRFDMYLVICVIYIKGKFRVHDDLIVHLAGIQGAFICLD